LYDLNSKTVVYATKPGDDIVKIIGTIPKNTSDIHGITKDMTLDKRPIKDHIDQFIGYCNQAKTIIGHNVKFDIRMVTEQIKKILLTTEDPKQKEIYEDFLKRFQLVGKNLPEDIYCTMTESKELCARIKGTNKLKMEKLMEVHKLLFHQTVGGKLHNALVDISVTLRVYLKLVLGIDICETISKIDSIPPTLTTNNEICNLINPIPIDPTIIESDDSTGEIEIISGLTSLPNGELEDKTIIAKTVIKDIATQFVKGIIKDSLNKVAPQQTICTSIIICTSIVKTGEKKGSVCGRPVTNGDFCGYHKPKNKIKPIVKTEEDTKATLLTKVKTDHIDEEDTTVPFITKTKPDATVKPDLTQESTSYVSKLRSALTKKNKVAPMGGKRKNKRNKKTKKRLNK
jgi:DNA polymerase III epsilon subunit-like protein